VETLTKRRNWPFLGALQREHNSHTITALSPHGAPDGTFCERGGRITDFMLVSMSCALLALLIVSLSRLFINISLSRSASVVGGASLCFMLGATMNGLIGRRRAALLARAELQRLVATRPTALIVLATPAGHIRYASPSFETILGFDPALVLGELAFQHVHPADSAEMTTHFARVWSSGIDQARFRLRHADGRWRWIEAHGARWGSHTQAALVIVGHDITEQVGQTTELLRLHNLHYISRITGAVAHDVNNLLTGIAGIAALDMQTLPSDHELYGDLATISHAADQAATLISHLRTFTRPPRFEPCPLDLNALVGRLAHFIERILGPEITVCVALSPSLAPVWGDSTQLEQVVLNVALNARDAMPRGGQLRIATTNVGQDTERTTPADWQPDTYVQLTISDTGVGMDGATQARMFEPYFTTKAPRRGTGLGLATCAEIIQRHRGRIHVESIPGQGTTVAIDLPCGRHDQTDME
jgi:two-component system cell cycle sensor histidine kinase/response regulator CckA